MNNVRYVTCSYAFLTGFKVFLDTLSKHPKIEKETSVYGIKVCLKFQVSIWTYTDYLIHLS